MTELNKLSLPIGLQIKEINKKQNTKQIGGSNHFIFTDNMKTIEKTENIVNFDIPLSIEPSKIDSFMIKDIYMI